MDDQQKFPDNSREGWQNQGESLNTGSAPQQNSEAGSEQHHEEHKKGGSALRAAALGRSATDQVRHHSASDGANVGTNISYEGPTAPGSGGSVGTGNASGQSATGSGTFKTTSEEDAGIVGKPGDKPE